ncbi:universal stress protein [Kozakia baliensis]|uniref:Universal stress protein UspA n=1 Tax=Kozakia baliensis TaxID=153496 RepID=A0A1D8USI0_9PROT|nr:universal stress protein [Kozakia baliensis]AOX16593.1 universal stress protein UspA [Kozakia baliensis]GBR23578.1 universal stress protein [Kozakia baliensis NRIC 0488]GEL65043.1 universal stress protein UspA [Kozakia baliensis]
MLILAILDRENTAINTLHAAGEIASRLPESHIVILHPRLDTNPDFQSLDEGIPTHAEREAFIQETTQRSDALRDIAARWIQDHDGTVRAQWMEIAGDVRKIVAIEAGRADLVVLSRPLRHDRAEVHKAFAAALYDAEATVLIAPLQRFDTVGLRPVIAWRPSSALQDVLGQADRLLRTAQQVTFLIGEDGRRHVENTPDIIKDLQDAGVPVAVDRFSVTDGHAGEHIREHALTANADLLIMGAYTHPRFLEWLFGGATQDILAHETLPILTHH